MKRIILLLDGTWNDRDLAATDSNIVRLEDIIAKSLAASSTPFLPVLPLVAGQGQGQETFRLTRGFTPDNVEHVVFYERGVGTGALDRLRGGGLGWGLARNVRRAYRFLSGHYQPGDQVFVFGFSRGAFTARSLVGFISASGLLKPENCSREFDEEAWRFYRAVPGDRLHAVKADLAKYTHPQDQTLISCVGVFDTVGALGVPLKMFCRANRARYEFHDVCLSRITWLNLHAIAIDEHRKPFEGTVWRRPKFEQFASSTEQVWFPGAHSDVGGGYILPEARQQQQQLALDDIALDWMLRRVQHFFPSFPCALGLQRALNPDCALASQHEARHGVYKFFRKAYRSIANQPVTSLGLFETEVGRDRHAHPIGEMIHISALLRLGEKVQVDRRDTSHAPRNLLSVLDAIETSYAPDQTGGTDLRVVGWDGAVLDPGDDEARRKVSDLVQAARQRLGRDARTKSSLPGVVYTPARA